MPWDHRKLADGALLGELGFGTWKIGAGATVVDQVEQAFEAGISHIDTAQVYGNETETGQAIHESGIDRKQLYITTKWSGVGGKGIRQSCEESLSKLNLKSVDLYLIHSPRLCQGDIVASWKQFLQLKKEGLIKSAGVSNFKISDLEEIRKAGLEMPVVNQILLHPYVYKHTKALLEYHAKHNIVTEAYSPLIPITSKPGGPLTVPLTAIAAVHGVPQAEILFAWARAKGAVIVTTSHLKERLLSYVHAGDVTLSETEIKAIDKAGAAHYWGHQVRKRALPMIACAALFAGLEYLRLSVQN